ncbi:Protein of uncharacterised function (DUF3196) [Mycoplasma putrefaciens]|uniref:DUF3196 domain-containing protein n=1 Tax=Mycoplasma putrefaciens (strain ATCC 15718 / NCTC 10155 / C30 KS-1 / KS-1) TaxID=743965 RepID=A0A7U3ZSI4_MYCPK|nr:DUF3196 family protein [Mycoplasma putrefaciens]AEM68732.1 uncharacterized protein MPUT_0355 [Mycoplasma putrefaciens KS1]SYV95957.1 Protein of uncharacterised function (DUF3196) [Mycoplasma putrefaciens]
MKNFYDELLENINDAIDQKNYENALKLINNELSMPYIPTDVEKKLLKLLKVIRNKQKEQLNLKTESYDFYKIKSLLNSDDYLQQLLAFKHLKTINIKLLLDDIKQFLIDKKNKNENKTLLLMTLAELEFDFDFKVIKNKQYLINPVKIDFNYIDQKLLEIEELISKIITDKNPSFIVMAKQVLYYFYFDNFPDVKLEDVVEIAIAVVDVVYQIIGIKSDLTTLINHYKFDHKKVEQLVNTIKKSGALKNE